MTKQSEINFETDLFGYFLHLKCSYPSVIFIFNTLLKNLRYLFIEIYDTELRHHLVTVLLGLNDILP